MDKKSKLIIVALILIGVVFTVGLGTNLLPKRGTLRGGRKRISESRKNLSRDTIETAGSAPWIT